MSSDRQAELEPVVALTDDCGPWSDAVWVGQVDADRIGLGPVVLAQGSSFARARVLVWGGDSPRGFVEVGVRDGVVDGAELAAEVAVLPAVEAPSPGLDVSFSVVVCTKDRPEQLRDTLRSLVGLRHPSYEVVVVDNGPASGLTAPVVAEFAAQGVRTVPAPRAGLSFARNIGLESAREEFVAFTDDDVLVDERWLEGLARGFARADDVACVTGMVPTAELVTPAQSYFDRRVGWAVECSHAVYDLGAPPADDPLFPLQVARFGTGANFAVRRSAIRRLGGFDEGLGVGSPTQGGEDIDLFVRVLLAGHRLVHEPGALIWHRHRRSMDDLEAQIYNYGVGLGAWITKLLLRPRTLFLVVRRGLAGVAHLRSVTAVEAPATTPATTPVDTERLTRLERRGVLAGPWALLRSRLGGRRATPLRARVSGSRHA